MRLAVFALALLLTLGFPSADELSLKDAPRRLLAPTPEAAPPFIFVSGIEGRWTIPPDLMRAYHLRSGMTISRDLARTLAAELDFPYSDQLRTKLKTLDPEDPL